MSQLVKHVHAYEYSTYFFKIALDHAPDPGEVDDIETRIKGAMESLGVPAEQVGVAVFKSALPSGTDTPQTEDTDAVRSDKSYLLCVLVKTEDGGFTEDPSVVAERAVRAFSTFGELPPQNVAAVVLENAYLEVDTKKANRTPVVW